MFLNQLFGINGNNDGGNGKKNKGCRSNQIENAEMENGSRKLLKSFGENVTSYGDSDNSNENYESRIERSPRKTVKIGMYSIDSSYEISLLALVLADKLFKKYSSQCLYICHKPFSLLKKNYFGCESAYSDKEDIRKLAKFLFYMDDKPFSEMSHLIENIYNLDYIFTYGTDKLLGNPNYNSISGFVRWIEDSNQYNYIFCDIGDNLDLENIEFLRECDVIVRGSRNFPGSMDTLDMDRRRTIDVIFDANTESDLGCYASDINKVNMLRDGEFSYSFQLNNDLEFLIDNLMKCELVRKTFVSKVNS